MQSALQKNVIFVYYNLVLAGLNITVQLLLKSSSWLWHWGYIMLPCISDFSLWYHTNLIPFNLRSVKIYPSTPSSQESAAGSSWPTSEVFLVAVQASWYLVCWRARTNRHVLRNACISQYWVFLPMVVLYNLDFKSSASGTSFFIGKSLHSLELPLILLVWPNMLHSIERQKHTALYRNWYCLQYYLLSTEKPSRVG